MSPHGSKLAGIGSAGATDHSESHFKGPIVVTQSLSKDPLHGITLEMILEQLVQQYGWAELARRIPIRCFYNEPSIKSSLKFLRRTPWARKNVEELYLQFIGK